MGDDGWATTVRLGDGRPRDPSALPPRGPRFLGLAQPGWIIAGAVSIVLIIVGVVIMPGLSSPGRAEPGIGGVGALSTGGVPSTTDPEPSGPASASAEPSVSVSTSPTDPAPVDVEPLQVRVSSSTIGLAGLNGWRVTATIANPAAVDQAWRSLSVQVDLMLGQGAVTSRTAGTQGYVSANNNRLACVSPTTEGVVAAGESITVQFDISVLRLLDRPPHHEQLNDPNCQPPQAG